MISRLDSKDHLNPTHLHGLGGKDLLDGRMGCRSHISKRLRPTKHKLILANPQFQTRNKRSMQSYYWSTVRPLDEDFWRSSEKRYLPPIRNRHFRVAKLPPERDFFVNWFQIIARDNQKRPLQKIPKSKDQDARVAFAKSIGLSELPPTSDDSFNRLYGLFDTIMKSDSEHDSVQTIRRLRRE